MDRRQIHPCRRRRRDPGRSALRAPAVPAPMPPEAVAPWQGPGQRDRPAPLDPGLRHPGAAFAQPAVLAGGPERARPDPAALRPAAPAARDRPVLAPDHDEPRHLHRAAGHRRARARPAHRDHALSRRRLRPGASWTRGRWRSIRLVADAACAQGPAVRADPEAPHQPQRLRPGAAGAGRRLAGDGRGGEAAPAALRLRRPRPARIAGAAARRGCRGLAHRDGDAAHDHGVVQGAARRRRRGGAPPRRPDAARPDGGVDGAPGPVRPQPGAGPGRLRHHQPDQGLRREARLRRPASCGW